MDDEGRLAGGGAEGYRLYRSPHCPLLQTENAEDAENRKPRSATERPRPRPLAQQSQVGVPVVLVSETFCFMRRFCSLAIVVSVYIVYDILPAEPDINHLRLSKPSNPSTAEEKEREARRPALPTAASSPRDISTPRPSTGQSNSTLHSEDKPSSDDISDHGTSGQ